MAHYNAYPVPGTRADTTGLGDLDPLTPGVQQPSFAGNTPGFSPKFISLYNDRDNQQKAYTHTDLSLTCKPEDEKFTVQAFVRNIENTRPLTGAGFVAARPDDIYNWQFGTSRVYGVRVGVDF